MREGLRQRQVGDTAPVSSLRPHPVGSTGCWSSCSWCPVGWCARAPTLQSVPAPCGLGP